MKMSESNSKRIKSKNNINNSSIFTDLALTQEETDTGVRYWHYGSNPANFGGSEG